jgi:hypothetical protein
MSSTPQSSQPVRIAAPAVTAGGDDSARERAGMEAMAQECIRV